MSFSTKIKLRKKKLFSRQFLPLLLATFFLSLISCSPGKDHSISQNESLKSSKSLSSFKLANLFNFFESKNNSLIIVMDESGTPLANANVMIGTQSNVPFENNIFTTNSNGQIQIPASTLEQWKSPLPVTAWANGKIPVTYFQQLPNTNSISEAAETSISSINSVPESTTSGPIQFYLKTSLNRSIYELKGQGTSGFDVKDKDGWIDFALMFESISRPELLNFDLSMIISPQNDTIEVAGQSVSLPSNVSLPKQKESYFLPVTLEKPVYRSYFYTPGSKLFYALKGRFPFKTVVKEMQDDKPFHELINHFQIQSGTLRNVAISSSSHSLDLPVNELKFTESRHFKAPNFNSQEYMIAIAGSQFEQQFIPTDIKTVEANQTSQLVTAAGSAPILLTVIQRKDHPDVVDRISSAITVLSTLSTQNMGPNDPITAQPTMIPLMEKPQLAANNTVKLMLPTLPTQLQKTGTYAVLSDIKVKKAGDFNAEVADARWEVYAPSWIPEFQLPLLPTQLLNQNQKSIIHSNEQINPNDIQAKSQQRWDVTVLANSVEGNSKINVDLGPRLFHDSTHATRSSQNFQTQ